MSVKLSFFTGGGTDGIGGNKILLEADGTALFLDFGKSFKEEKKYFDEYLRPRSLNGLGDLFAFDLIPPIRGIYRNDLQHHRQDWEDRLSDHPAFRADLNLAGVLLSHAHLDHSGSLSLLRPDIPVYTSLESAVIAKVIQDSGQSDFLAETVYAKPRIVTEEGWLTSDTTYKIPSTQRPYQVFTSRGSAEGVRTFWETVCGKRPLCPCPLTPLPDGHGQAGRLSLRFWPVDHSIPGAGAFGIETREGWVIYTGDLRRHGLRAGDTRRFIEEAAKLQPLLLIIEGTRAGADTETSSRHLTEQDVADRIREIVGRAAGLVVADFGARNLERLSAVLQAAAETRRTLVITTRDTLLLEALCLCDPSYPNPLRHPHILVLAEARATRATWEKDLLERCASRKVKAREISRNPNDFVLCLSYYDLHELIDIDPASGTYLYSSTEAFNEEMELDAARLLSWIHRFGFTLHGNPMAPEHAGQPDPLHVGGHARPAELLEIIETIRPRHLLPIHTERFDFFEEHFGQRADIRLVRPVVGGSWQV